jgi:tetratricopeptide (TPR) repeat protein
LACSTVRVNAGIRIVCVMATLVMTVVGTAATVIATIIAVLQLRRTQVSRHRDHEDHVEGDAVRLAVGTGQVGEQDPALTYHGRRLPAIHRAQGSPAVQPVMLLPPTGRLGEVRGRDEILAVLAQALTAPDEKFHVLAGLGGVGKTTIALALAERARKDLRHIWWVSAVDQASVIDGMLSLALELGAPPADVDMARAGDKSPAQIVWAQLDACPAWLLVLDNADDLEALGLPGSEPRDGTGWLRPTRSGLLLVTSRVSDKAAWGWHAQLHLVGCLDDDDGGHLLVDLAPHAGGYEEARLLSNRLGGLPLALHHAGSSLGSAFTAERSFASYRKALTDKFPLDLGVGQDQRALVTETWELSLDALASNGKKQARPILRILSCFAPSVEIPPILLDTAIMEGVCEGRSQAEVHAGLQALLSVGLIETRHEAGSLDHPAIVIHPLVADVSRLHLDAQITAAAAQMMESASFRLELDNPRDWPRWQALLPHLRSLLTLPPAAIEEQTLIAIAHAAARTAYGLNWGGAHIIAGELARTALKPMSVLGAEHEAVLGLRFGRAMSDRYQGRYIFAEKEFRDIVSLQSRILGVDDPRTLATRQELARVISNLGRYSESEAACREVLEAAQRVLGPENVDTLTARYYLARLIGERGRYREAEAAFRDLLNTSTRALGPEHPLTLIVRNHLAVQLNNQRQYTQGEEALRKLLDDWTRITHHDYTYTYVLDIRYELGRALVGQARYEEADGHFRNLLDDEFRVRGPQHPHALLARREMAVVMAAQDDPASAESELRDVREIQAQTLGPDHPRTLITMRCLAASVAAQGRNNEAIALYRQTYDRQSNVLGINHPDTVITMNELTALTRV